MSLERKIRRLLAAEQGGPPRPPRRGLGVAVVYPNTYWVGMSNLGFQAVHHLLAAQPGIRCERAFLPDPEDLDAAAPHALYRTLEGRAPLKAMDVLAFSVSFELDYPNVVRILAAAGVPPLRSDRRPGRDPLVLAGGIAPTINPEPLAEIADLIYVGEAEATLPALAELLARSDPGSAGREGLLAEAAALPGVYVPSGYTPRPGPGRSYVLEPAPGFPPRVSRARVRDLDACATQTRILTPNTEMKRAFLIEVGRGCGRHCRFCAAGYLYRPPRFRSAASVLAAARRGRRRTERIGLVGTAVSDHPAIPEMARELDSMEARVSVSSLRADALDPALVALLARSGHKTVALAPEAGSPRLRRTLNKDLSDRAVLDGARALFEAGIPNLRLYFMIGLPGEDREDLDALVELVRRIHAVQLAAARPRGRIGRIVVSLNCFVPKAQTPLQWAPMHKKGALSAGIGYIKGRLRGEGNVRVIHDLPKWALVQGLLARGGRWAGRLLCEAVQGGDPWSGIAVLAREAGLHEAWDPADPLPWDVVASGVTPEYLRREWERAALGKPTAACPPDPRCPRCGACGETGS